MAPVDLAPGTSMDGVIAISRDDGMFEVYVLPAAALTVQVIA